MVLANAAIKGPRLILIDEPELNLHPRLQLDFLTALHSFAEYGVWFSTHSIGLARAAGQKVYSVLRHGDGDSSIHEFHGSRRLAEFLGEMSFSSHRELGFGKILLVEGPTDVPAFQQFLSRMSKGHKVVLLPLHGHMPEEVAFEELLRISTNVAVLVDSERASAGAPLEPKRQSFLDMCAQKNIPAQALERRATENYFLDAVVKEVFGQTYRALDPYERLNDANPHWSKSQNWKLAAAMPIAAIRQTDLGKFLDAL